VITNASDTNSGSILSLTKLRATNADGQPVDGGVEYVTAQEALQVMNAIVEYQNTAPIVPEQPPQESEQDGIHRQMANEMFDDVRKWLNTEAQK
jgi:hypothetical protein